MAKTVKTMNLKGNAYAKVADRTKEFWQDHPNGKIYPVHKTFENGTVEAVAYIWKDKSEFLELLKGGVSNELALLSADSSGSAQAKAEKVNAEKGFEKLETIAVGRALGLLGYLANGEVATDEEMQAFEDFKAEKAAEARQTACNELEKAKTVEELKAVFSALPRDLWQDVEVIAKKDEMKEKLSKESVEEVKNNNANEEGGKDEDSQN